MPAQLRNDAGIIGAAIIAAEQPAPTGEPVAPPGVLRGPVAGVTPEAAGTG